MSITDNTCVRMKDPTCEGTKPWEAVGVTREGEFMEDGEYVPNVEFIGFTEPEAVGESQLEPISYDEWLTYKRMFVKSGIEVR